MATENLRQVKERELGEYGVVTDPNTIRFERLLPGPIERVWAYLTESEKRGKWFASGEMDLRVGGRAQLTFRHADLNTHKEPTPEKYKEFEGEVSFDHRITRCEPPRLLGFTWDGESEDGSEVIFELTPRGDHVLLVLTHSRLADRAAMKDVSGGWHIHLTMLEDNLTGVEPRPFWSTLATLEAEYERRLAGA